MFAQVLNSNKHDSKDLYLNIYHILSSYLKLYTITSTSLPYSPSQAMSAPKAH